MEIPFQGAQRSQWLTNDRWAFFCKIESLFKTLERDDKIEIKLRLKANDPDFFEIPIYDKPRDEEPSVIAMFEQDKVFIDFINPENKQKWLEKIQALAGETAKPSAWRDLTQKDWLKRLNVMDSL